NRLQAGDLRLDDRPQLADLLEAHADRVGEVPVEILLPRKDGANVAAPHGHDDVGPFDVFTRDRLRAAMREIEADLFHRLDDRFVQLLLGTRAGRSSLAAASLVERLRHLRAPGIADAEEV